MASACGHYWGLRAHDDSTRVPLTPPQLPLRTFNRLENEVEIFTGGRLSEDATGHLAQVAESDPRGAIALIQQLPEGDRQRDLTRQLLNDLFEKDPVSLRVYRLFACSARFANGLALASIGEQKDTGGAVAWAKNCPQGPVRSQALFSLCADWAAVDPQEERRESWSTPQRQIFHSTPRGKTSPARPLLKIPSPCEIKCLKA